MFAPSDYLVTTIHRRLSTLSKSPIVLPPLKNKNCQSCTFRNPKFSFVTKYYFEFSPFLVGLSDFRNRFNSFAYIIVVNSAKRIIKSIQFYSPIIHSSNVLHLLSSAKRCSLMYDDLFFRKSNILTYLSLYSAIFLTWTTLKDNNIQIILHFFLQIFSFKNILRHTSV